MGFGGIGLSRRLFHGSGEKPSACSQLARKKPVQRGIGYLRCSTAEQRESGLGLSAQRDAIESAAKREGLAVAEWFTDEGVSGAHEGIARYRQ